jgi:hypothetical protein
MNVVRPTLASILGLALLLPNRAPAQTPAPRAAKIHEQLSKLTPGAEIEVRLLSTGAAAAPIRGHLKSFNQTELVLTERQTPIPLSDIQTIKSVRAPKRPAAAWNPLTGFVRPLAVAAIAAAAILALGVYAAKNTR